MKKEALFEEVRTTTDLKKLEAYFNSPNLFIREAATQNPLLNKEMIEGRYRDEVEPNVQIGLINHQNSSEDVRGYYVSIPTHYRVKLELLSTGKLTEVEQASVLENPVVRKLWEEKQ